MDGLNLPPQYATSGQKSLHTLISVRLSLDIPNTRIPVLQASEAGRTAPTEVTVGSGPTQVPKAASPMHNVAYV